MNNVLLMCHFQCAGDLHGVLQALLQPQRTGQGIAINVLHHQVIWSDIVNLADIGMIQRRNGLRLAFEALAELSSGNFDRHVAFQTWISGAVNFPHTARADKRNDLIRAEFVAGRERHRRDLASLIDHHE